MNNKAKESVFVEFKSTLIDNRFQKIKINLLKHLGEIEGKILFSYYEKKQKNMKESLKESIYITLLINMVNSIEESIDIIFDCFGNKQFENNIIETLIVYNSIKSIKPCDSQEMPGLQFVDNVCSVIRLHLTQHDKENYYSYIEKMIERV